MKDCIRKTNDQVFGGIVRGCKKIVGTEKGRRNAAVMIAAVAIVCLDVGLGVWIANPLMQVGQEIMHPIWAGIVVGITLTTNVVIGVVTVVYALTLSENCNG